MTYTFKIAKRLARMRWFSAFLVSGALACVAGESGSNEAVSLHISPNAIVVPALQIVSFQAIGFNAGGDSMPLDVVWNATGGTITLGGSYMGTSPGTFLITASQVDGDLADTASVTVTGPGEPATSIVVSPATANRQAGQSADFDAWGLTAAGDSVGVNVSWSSSGGSVASDGTFQSLVAGTYLVIAVQAGGTLADTASVTVSSAPPPPPTTIVLSPSSASVETGQAVDFDAWGTTAAGDSVGVNVTWSATGGTINGSGTFSAQAAGTYAVTADQVGGSLSRSAFVTVTDPTPPPPPPPSGLVNECNTPQAGWVWCDDFDQDRLASYFEYDAHSGAFTRTNGVGNGGSYGMRASFAPGQINAGSLHLAVGQTPQVYFRPADAGTANYRELYWRVYVKNEAGWTGGGGDKLTRAFSFASTTTWAQSMFGHVWSGGTGNNHLALDPASGTDVAGNLQTTAYNDFPNMRWLGAAPSSTPIFDSAHVGQWYCVEAHVKLNTSGQSDGLFELWINGNSEASKTGLNWVGNFNAYGINAVYLENYWNAGSPQQQERYLDNFVVSTQRIGC